MNVEQDLAGPLISKLSRAQIVVLALLGVILVAVPDYLIGFEISLSIFYLCPVGIAAWYAGIRVATLIVVFATLAGLAAEIVPGHLDLAPWILTWNGFLHFGFMLIVAYLLDRLRVHIENERQLARLDALTGILNRRAFTEHLQYRLALAARDGKPFALAYIDLDDFKQINDCGGHGEGDRVLRLVAGTLRRSIRYTDVVARLGGDEFALLLIGADRTGAECLIAKIRRSFVEVFSCEQPWVVTCSIGCVIFQSPPTEIDEAIRAADALMYQVKKQGKNAVAFQVSEDHGIPPFRRADCA